MNVRRTRQGPLEYVRFLVGFEEYLREKGDGIFDPSVPVTVARAPARIDCMGGIADYSGSLVFEGTLGRAAVVGFQPSKDGLLRVKSALLEGQGRPCRVEVFGDDLREEGRPVAPDEARRILTCNAESAWAAYLLGAVYVLEREGLCRLERGANLLLWSDIPIGVGVASSAALEVATMYAAACALKTELDGSRLARLAQTVENRVVGAPCGIMDQLTSALGEAGTLLAIRCQPAEVVGLYELPAGTNLFGVSSRVEHSVGGAAYTAARVAAFMGLKIILRDMEARGEHITERGQYLCNIPPDEYRTRYRSLLPEVMKGSEFLASYGETTDPVTRVEPGKDYFVRSGAEHPIYENYRVSQFIRCIECACAGDRAALVEAGTLMYASHNSYSSNCMLGSAETDLLVSLVKQRGPERGLYGAKITGGGSGGTVAILAQENAAAEIQQIARDYEAQTGIAPDIFQDTSPGTLAFGPWQYVLE